MENNAVVPIFGNVTPEIAQRAQGETKLAEVKADIDKMMREEHPIIMQTADGLYAVMSATGKVIYVTREVLIEVVPLALSGPIAGALRAGKAVQFVATHPRVVTLSEKAMEGIAKTANKAKELVSEGIYYSYNPVQIKAVQTTIHGIESGIGSIAQITPAQYAKAAVAGTGASATAQYLVKGEVDWIDASKTGLVTPYSLYTSAGTSFVAGAVYTMVDSIVSKKSIIEEQNKNIISGVVSEGAIRSLPPTPAAKNIAPLLGIFVGQVVNQALSLGDQNETKK